MPALLTDLKLAFRSLSRAPVFTAAAVLTLALGIGLDSAMFSVFDRLLLRPLPLENLDTLMGVYEGDTQLGWTHNVVSAANFVDFQRQNTQFDAMAAHVYHVVNLSDDGDAERVLAGRVSHTFFSILQVRPALGRDFTAEEDRAGGPKVVILTDGFWRSRFGSDPEVLGRTLRLQGVPHEIVGVLPAGFHLAGHLGGTIYIPMAFTAEELADRGRHSYNAIGRLKPDATVAGADAQLKQVAEGLAALYPDTNEFGSATVEPLLEQITQGNVPYAALFLSLSSFLLLIACANVSNLILARGATRQRELAIRTALGGGRGALIRHLSAESLWLGLTGGLVSLLVADGLVTLMQHWFPRVAPISEMTLDARALAISFGVTLAAVIISGFVPAWRLSFAEPAAVLKDGANSSRGREQHRFQSALLAVQVGLSVVLLAGAGLMVRTLVKLEQVPLGFEPGGILAADIALPRARYTDDEARQDFARRLYDRLRALPQIERAAVANSLPLWGSAGNWPYGIEGEERASDQGVVWTHAVSPDYFALLEIPLKAGRLLEASDAERCLVNLAFVRRHWPDGAEPLGRRVQLFPPQGPVCTVAGVVGDAHNLDLSQTPVPQIYTSLFQEEFQGNRFLYAYLKTPGDPLLLTRQMKDAVRELDPYLAAAPIRSLEEVLDLGMRAPRVATSLFAGFGALGLLLAAIGLYGLMTFTITRRTREMGIRQALGADVGRMVRMVLGHSLRHVLWGLGFGLLACVALSPTMASFLFGVAPTDLVTLGTVAATVLGVSVVAALVPAVRAASIRPAEALRDQ